jgi:TolB-like protein
LTQFNRELGEAMEEQHELTAANPDAQTPTVESADHKKKKKKDKVRSAWISFVGRIVAQVTGAAATLSLGLMLMQGYQFPAIGRAATEPVVPVRLATPGETSVAVLPLQTYSTDGDTSFADGMTEALITDLARLESIRVVSRTSSMLYKQHQQLMPAIGRALSVDFVIEGSVIKDNGRVRITAQLIDARRDEHIWAESYDRPLLDILAIQSEVAAAIAAVVKTRVAQPALVNVIDRYQ